MARLHYLRHAASSRPAPVFPERCRAVFGSMALPQASAVLSSGWLVFVSCPAAAIFGINGLLALLVACKVPPGGVAGQGFHLYWRIGRWISMG